MDTLFIQKDSSNSVTAATATSRVGNLSRATRALENLFLLVVIACALLSVARGFVRIHLPFQMDYAEGAILNTSWRAAQGQTLYTPIDGMPYELDPYPPVIYKLVGFIVAHFGLSLFYPRLLVLWAAIAACLLASILIHHWTRKWGLAFAFGSLPLTVAVVQTWLGVLRYDFIGIALSLAGLAIFVLLPKYRYWSIPFFAVSVAGLYTLVAAPGTCFLYLWMQRERKKSLIFGFLLALALFAGLFYGQYITGGWMARHLFQSQHSPYSVSQLASFVESFLRGYALLFLLGGFIIWKSVVERRISLIALYWCLVTGTSLSLGKVGAEANHMLQLVFATCISAGVAYEWLRQNSSDDVGTVLALSTLIFITMSNAPLRTWKPIEELTGCRQAYSAVRSDLGDRILSDNVGALVLGGKRVFISDPFTYRWLVTYAGLPDDDLRKMITSREFTSIVIEFPVADKLNVADRWPEDIRQAIRENYQVKEQFNCTDARFIYEPKQASSSTPQDELGNARP